MSDLSEQKPIIKIKDQIGLIGVLLAAFSAPFTMAFNIGADRPREAKLIMINS